MTSREQHSAYEASNPSTPPEVLAQIAEHRPELRALVAANPSTPAPVVQWLGGLGDVAVDAALRRRASASAAPFAAPSAGSITAMEGPAPTGWQQPDAGPQAAYGQPAAYQQAGQAPYGYPGGQPVGPWTTAQPQKSGSAVKWIIAGSAVVVALVVAGIVAGILALTSGPDAYGDDTQFDALWDSCEAGDGQACDDLFMDSPLGSEYEEFGGSCGGRFPGTDQYCVDLM